MPDPPLLRGRHEIGRNEIASLLTSHNLLCSSLRFSCLPKEHFYCPFLSVELLFILWDSTQMLPPPWSTAPPQWMNCLFLKSLTDPRSHVLLQQAQILLKRHLPVISYVTLASLLNPLPLSLLICKKDKTHLIEWLCKLNVMHIKCSTITRHISDACINST